MFILGLENTRARNKIKKKQGMVEGPLLEKVLIKKKKTFKDNFDFGLKQSMKNLLAFIGKIIY